MLTFATVSALALLSPGLRPASRPALRPAFGLRASPAHAGVPYEQPTVGVIKETRDLERRVAQSPDSVASLVKAGFKVAVEKDAGAAALFGDDQYEAAGASIVSAGSAWESDFVVKINPPTAAEAALLGGRTLIAQMNPSKNTELVGQLAGQGATVFALDMIPRLLSRGQTYDTLSSQTNIAGYRAVVEVCRGPARSPSRSVPLALSLSLLALSRG